MKGMLHSIPQYINWTGVFLPSSILTDRPAKIRSPWNTSMAPEDVRGFPDWAHWERNHFQEPRSQFPTPKRIIQFNLLPQFQSFHSLVWPCCPKSGSFSCVLNSRSVGSQSKVWTSNIDLKPPLEWQRFYCYVKLLPSPFLVHPHQTSWRASDSHLPINGFRPALLASSTCPCLWACYFFACGEINF